MSKATIKQINGVDYKFIEVEDYFYIDKTESTDMLGKTSVFYRMKEEKEDEFGIKNADLKQFFEELHVVFTFHGEVVKTVQQFSQLYISYQQISGKLESRKAKLSKF